MKTLILAVVLGVPGSACFPAMGHIVIKQKGKNTPISVADIGNNCDSLRFRIWDYQGELDSASECDSLYALISIYEGEQDWQDEYDSAKKFITMCYNDPRAPGVFGDIQAALQPLAEADTSLWMKHQAWLESVLYLNTTPEYFCACVEHFILGNPAKDTGEELVWKGIDKGLALDRWLIENTTCDTPFLRIDYDQTRKSMHDDWLNDTTVPYDTTLLPLDSIEPGLQELLDRHFLYADVSERIGPNIIISAAASPNPVSAGTIISFGISKEAYVKIEVFDILGNRVSSAGFESLFEPGNKAVPLSLQGLPAGTYFARIVTAYGEVQTVKLVKE